MKKINYFLLGVVICAVTIVAYVAVIAWGESTTRTHDGITVTVGDEVQKTLHAELNDFYPGQTQTYEITFSYKSSVSLTFENAKGSEVLQDEILVAITKNDADAPVLAKTLRECLDSGAIDFGSNTTKLTLTYTMFETSGNETQNAALTFDLVVSAKGK